MYRIGSKTVRAPISGLSDGLCLCIGGKFVKETIPSCGSFTSLSYCTLVPSTKASGALLISNSVVIAMASSQQPKKSKNNHQKEENALQCRLNTHLWRKRTMAVPETREKEKQAETKQSRTGTQHPTNWETISEVSSKAAAKDKPKEADTAGGTTRPGHQKKRGHAKTKEKMGSKVKAGIKQGNTKPARQIEHHQPGTRRNTNPGRRTQLLGPGGRVKAGRYSGGSVTFILDVEKNHTNVVWAWLFPC